MPGLTAEVVANSNSAIQVFTSSVLANTQANGSACRITAGGFVSPGTFGSETFQPAVNVSIYVGANGTSADPLISSFVVPSNQNLTDNGPLGSFAFDTLVTLRANAKSAGATANAVYTGIVLDPFSSQFNAAGNANVNSAWSASNTANISVYAVAGPMGQNANLIFEQCFITQLT
jgi:hypothetical protein